MAEFIMVNGIKVNVTERVLIIGKMVRSILEDFWLIFN